jgi:brefeldin A-inhibited guanine nucleotide-exchange protein
LIDDVDHIQVKKGKQRFNLKPKDGIKFLIGIGYLQNNPKDIASFLFNADGLDKEQIGEYLGGKDEINRKVLYEYVDSHFNFKASFLFYFLSWHSYFHQRDWNLILL